MVREYMGHINVWRAYIDKVLHVPIRRGEPNFQEPPTDDDALLDYEPPLRVPNVGEYHEAMFHARELATQVIRHVDQ